MLKIAVSHLVADAVQQLCSSHDTGSYDVYKVASAGAVAGGCRALSRTLTYPFDTLKTIAQAGDSPNKISSDTSTNTSSLSTSVVSVSGSNDTFHNATSTNRGDLMRYTTVMSSKCFNGPDESYSPDLWGGLGWFNGAEGGMSLEPRAYDTTGSNEGETTIKNTDIYENHIPMLPGRLSQRWNQQPDQQPDEQPDQQPDSQVQIKYFRGVYIAFFSAIPSNAIFFIVYYALEYYFPCTVEWSSIYFPLLATINSKMMAASSITSAVSGATASASAVTTAATTTASGELGKSLQRILFSSIATLPQNAIKIPFEVVKQRAQLQPDTTYAEIVRDAVREKGIRGLYAGGFAQLLREIPYNAFQMSSFDLLKDEFVSKPLLRQLLSDFNIDSGLEAALLGCLAALIAAVLTQPADVLKTKLMAAGSASSAIETGEAVGDEARATEVSAMPRVSLSATARTASRDGHDNDSLEAGKPTKELPPSSPLLLSVAKEIWAQAGWRGFFVGLKSRLVIVSIGGMVYFYAANLVESYGAS